MIYPSVPAAFPSAATVFEWTRRPRRVGHTFDANSWWIFTELSMRYGEETAGNYKAGIKKFHREGPSGSWIDEFEYVVLG